MATSTRPSKNGNYGPFGPDQQAFQSLPHPGRHSLKPTHERPAVLTQSPLHQSPAIFCRPARARPLAPPRDATRLPSRRPHRRPSATRDATHAATRPAANFSAAPSPRAVPCRARAALLFWVTPTRARQRPTPNHPERRSAPGPSGCAAPRAYVGVV